MVKKISFKDLYFPLLEDKFSYSGWVHVLVGKGGEYRSIKQISHVCPAYIFTEEKA
jgi:hypothetical protein